MPGNPSNAPNANELRIKAELLAREHAEHVLAGGVPLGFYLAKLVAILLTGEWAARDVPAE